METLDALLAQAHALLCPVTSTIGAQVVGRRHGDAELLRVAAAIQAIVHR